MSTITIREREKTENGFKASLSFEGGTEYEIEVSNPFTAQEEARLEWYFERWLVFPHLETVKAQAAKESVRQYGEKLFEQVFKSDVDAYSDYKEIKAQIKQIEIAGNSPEFQALHWEALQDPQQPRPLAVDCVMVRKRGKNPAGKALVEPSPVIKLLVVTARPGEEKDVNHRTISRPLMAAIQKSKLRVQVDLLRPATFEALSDHLEEKGAGYYHIVHLDMHGAVMSYAEVKELKEKEKKSNPGNPLIFRDFGNELKEFTGYKALLSFESGIPGRTDLREASELADLLTGKNIPVCILNACQSAKQVQGDERETSLGAALMAAGMQAVLAMSYSITVSAAEILMTTLYQQLFARKSLDEAMRLGRKELYHHQERKAYFDRKIRLEDWLLPVVYRREPVDFRLRSFTPEEEETYWQQQERSYRFETPTYGFVGRDLEILKIERALLRRNILLVQGMGGTGKTTLLNYLREWWQTTQFVKEVFYFSYDEKAYTLEQIVFAIGQRVYGKHEAAQFQAMELRARVSKLVATLRSENYGLMLDNLESVTGQQLAIQHTLNPEQQEELRDFLGRLVGGETKVVLGSRSREKWLDGVLNGAVYELRGLDEEARTTLAEQILERQVEEPRKIEWIRQSDEFKKLMKLLAGYPLAMQVVLGNLKRQTAAEILAGLDAADVNLDPENATHSKSIFEAKTASILKCVEYSHSNLSPEAQKLLLCLATFSGFLFRPILSMYAEQLQKSAPFQDYPFQQFDGAIEEAIAWGLLSPMDADNPQLLTIQPVFPYFLKTKLDRLDAGTREALWEGFKNHYRGLAGYYQQLMNSKEAQERQLGILFCNWEYENLYKALKICLEKQESIGIYQCLDTYLNVTSNMQDSLELSKFVSERVENYSSESITADIGFEIAEVYLKLGNCYLKIQDYSSARSTYLKLLESLQKLESLPDRQRQLGIASTYHQLGYVAQQLREFPQANDYYQQALQIFIEFGDRYEQASTYFQLGRVAEEMGELEAAKANYLQDLQITAEFNDENGLGISLRNLARFYQQTQDESILVDVASLFDVTVEELKAALPN